jgi:hypothetical protein
MSYSDWHISLSDLADYLRAPTIIITYDFSGMKIGKFNWFEGEARGTVSPSFVLMTVGEGQEYGHTYHPWEQEGYIMGKTNVVQYKRVGSWAHSIVIYVYPANGNFRAGAKGHLRDRSSFDTNYDCGDGVVAVKGDGKYHFIRGGESIGDVSASTVIRSASTISLCPRDDKYAHNLAAIVRGRLTADKCEHMLSGYTCALVSSIGDEMALSNGHLMHDLPINVVGMSPWRRIVVKTGKWVWARVPDPFSLFSTFVRRLVGDSRVKTFVPFAWTETSVPNYEVHAEMKNSTLGEPSRRAQPKQPFRSSGPDCVSGPDDRVVNYGRGHSAESDRVCGDSSSTRPFPDSPLVHGTDTQGRTWLYLEATESGWRLEPATAKGRDKRRAGPKVQDNSLRRASSSTDCSSTSRATKQDTAAKGSRKGSRTMAQRSFKSVDADGYRTVAGKGVGKKIPTVKTAPAARSPQTSDTTGPPSERCSSVKLREEGGISDVSRSKEHITT